MTLQETLKHLKSRQRKNEVTKHPARSRENQYGVRLGDIRKLAGKIKSNHPLTLEFWETGKQKRGYWQP